MLGTLRFILAYLVFLSHFPENGLKLNLGVVSVIVFYFISGFLMMRSYLRFQQHANKPMRQFYLDRCFKIFPQYLIVLFLTVVSYKFLGASPENTFMNTSFDFQRIVFDALLFPVSFSVGSVADFIPSFAGQPIIPPAWSLSVELHFYFLVPLLILLSTRILFCVFFISAILLTFSFFSTNEYWSTINFGYRYIVSMLVVFGFGMMTSSENESHKKMAFIIWAYFCVLFVLILPMFPAWYEFAVQEIVFGIIVAPAVFHYALNFKAKYGWLASIDRWLGDLSYPVFLSHYLAIYLAQHIFGSSSFAKIYFLGASISIFLFTSLLLACFQRYIDSKRIVFRGFQSMRSGKA
jgi:peptidoglycan/LPS O-acetylase OafA/YrhL